MALNLHEIGLPSGSVEVPARSSVNISIKAPRDFFPKRLVVPHGFAEDFLITDIKCRGYSQLISTGALPALFFSDLAFPEILYFDRLRENEDMIVSVTNQSQHNRSFSCRVLGDVEPMAGPRQHVLGCGSTLVAGRGSANINVQPLVEFTPCRLVIPSTIRQHFRVEGLYRVSDGERLSLFSSPDLLGQNFTELMVNDIDLEHSVSRKQFLTISVTNLTEQGRNFQAAVVGSRH
jgi:hypothetical protein